MSNFQRENNGFSLSRYFGHRADWGKEWREGRVPKAASTVTKVKPEPRKRSAPVSIRLSEPEKSLLKKRAGNQSLNAYVRSLLLDKTSSRPKPPDDLALARVLRALGQSPLVKELETLHWALEMGSVSLSASAEAALVSACKDITAMRGDLMKALGLRKAPP